jgi:hypothetical protein
LGAPYSDEEIAKAAEDVKGKTELDAVIAYLQVHGRSPQIKEYAPWTSTHLRCRRDGGHLRRVPWNFGVGSVKHRPADFDEAAKLPFGQDD